MSANIKWRPLGNGKDLSVNTPSAFIEALSLPAQFSASDLAFLRGVLRGRPDWSKAIEEIFDAIERHGAIEVFAVY